MTAIKKIAWGYVLIHSAISVGVIDLLPDWLGYYFMLTAIRELKAEEESMGLLEPLAKIMIAWTTIAWGSKLIGWDLSQFPFAIVINVISIYFHFQLLTNIANIAMKHGSERAKGILTARTIETVMNTILSVMVYLEMTEGLAITVAVIGLIAVIWICAALFGLAKELEAEQEVAI